MDLALVAGALVSAIGGCSPAAWGRARHGRAGVAGSVRKRQRGDRSRRAIFGPERRWQRVTAFHQERQRAARVPVRRHCRRECNRPKSTVAFRFQAERTKVAWPGAGICLGVRPPDLPVLWSRLPRAEQDGAARCRGCSWQSKSGCPSDDFGRPSCPIPRPESERSANSECGGQNGLGRLGPASGITTASGWLEEQECAARGPTRLPSFPEQNCGTRRSRLFLCELSRSLGASRHAWDQQIGKRPGRGFIGVMSLPSRPETPPTGPALPATAVSPSA